MTGPSTTRRFRHEAAIYGSDDELLEKAVPFLRGGVAAGEATLVVLPEREQGLVLDALGDSGSITPLASDEVYANPFTALESNHRTLLGLLGEGASRVRMLGQVPSAGVMTAWDSWARYEAAINHLYGPLEVWSVCPYDRRSTPGHVLADVERTHTHLTGPGDGNPAYTDPAAFLDERARRLADPLEATDPHGAQRDPTPGEARHMVGTLAGSTRLEAAAVERLVLAVSEVVTNAFLHGQSPVDVRAWAVPERVVVTVQDRGSGPSDAFVGFLPRRDGPGGLGMWMANQACSRVAMFTEPDGFTVRLTAGTPPP